MAVRAFLNLIREGLQCLLQLLHLDLAVVVRVKQVEGLRELGHLGRELWSCSQS